jgi:glycosyltransferase involved in cell wall biosynthesis
MSDRPLVSIGMPVFNCQDTLAAALHSILQQTYANWELFLLDDGSTDHTLRCAREFDDPRLHILADGERYGLAARLNQTLDLSRGIYFARMDGDDIAYPERLERQVAYLEEHPGVDLVGTAMMVFAENGEIVGKRAGPQTHAAICRRPTGAFRMFHPTYLGRLAWFQRYRYNVRLTVSQDQDLLLRAYRTSQFANLPEILLGYREEKLNLAKILKSRWTFVRTATRYFWVERRSPLMVLMACVEQVLKATLDILATGTNLNYRLLSQRAQQSCSDVEIKKWQHVWSSVSEVTHER